MPNRVSVSSADFIRNIGYWQSEAMRHPIAITHHGRERLILAATDHFQTNSTTNESELQRALENARTLNAAVLDHVEEGYIRFDEHLAIVSVNRVVDDVLGRPREALIGASLSEAMPSIASSAWLSHIQRVHRSRKPETFESKINQVHVRCRAFPLLDGVAVVFHNITEEVRLREACEINDAQTAALLEIPGLSTVQINHQTRIDYCDDPFTRLTGFTNAELLGHRFSDIVGVEKRRDLGAALERVLGDAERARLTVDILKKTGEPLAATLALAPIMSDLVVRGVYALLYAST